MEKLDFLLFDGCGRLVVCACNCIDFVELGLQEFGAGLDGFLTSAKVSLRVAREGLLH